MTVEMMETNPSTVLSPIFREMLAKVAKNVKRRYVRFSYCLCVDAPGYKSKD
jgi:hypothetical protein